MCSVLLRAAASHRRDDARVGEQKAAQPLGVVPEDEGRAGGLECAALRVDGGEGNGNALLLQATRRVERPAGASHLGIGVGGRPDLQRIRLPLCIDTCCLCPTARCGLEHWASAAATAPFASATIKCASAG